MQVSSVAVASQALVAAQRKAYADLTPKVIEVDKQAVPKAQVALSRSDVRYL